MRVVLLFLLSALLVLGSQPKTILFLSQLESEEAQRTFREQRQSAGGRGDEYFFQVNDRRSERLRRYMSRDDGELIGTYGDEDDWLSNISDNDDNE